MPGLDLRLEETALDLRYHAAFKEIIPDAYECLLLDALRGEKSLFIRADELAAAWDIFTPVLHETRDARVRPEPYPLRQPGPAATRGSPRAKESTANEPLPFASPGELTEAAASLLARHIALVPAPGWRAVMLSGGQTPLPVYQALAAEGMVAAPDMRFFLSDERYVPPHHPESNARNDSPTAFPRPSERST